EPAERHAGLGVKQRPDRGHPTEAHREIAVPQVSRFEARELSGIANREAILRGRERPLDAGPLQFALEADQPLRRELPVAAGLTAEQPASGVVVEGTELGGKSFKSLGRPGGDRLAEVIGVVAPAVAAVNANVAARPIERRNRRHGRRRLIDRPDVRRVGGPTNCQRKERDACEQQFFHDPLLTSNFELASVLDYTHILYAQKLRRAVMI